MKTIVLCALGAIAQDDAASITSSLLVARGDIELIPAFLGCYLGTAGGDLLTIAVGAIVGRRALRWSFLRRRIDDGRLDRLSRWMTETHRGSSVVFLSRFLAGIRTILHLAIGILHVSWARIVPLVLIAGVIHVGVVFALVVGVGEAVQKYLPDAGIWSAWPMLLVGVVAWLGVRVVGRWIARSAASREIVGVATADLRDESPEASGTQDPKNESAAERV